ncbi:sugar ABC transporter substrate-binding protein [Micromonospora avicenniae]|uniref:Monosaccharide ABC transporter substrate-binding protein, CUT2 family n=1 Tax=Micromonospora avicenniae TaxID=1198245 RepID=A0A1N6VYL1_9ACTN|nr:sugar ABC transporter substrate-binding protein [Micromonospora avicenniae]SIQ82949.1 monosaccharide ABC transporter substrate-binding protein, CUT2 family [Micromonospora avicenniae]
MRRRTALTAVVTVTTALALAGCGQESTDDPAPGQAGGKPTVCLVMKSLANEYFQQMQTGAVTHVKERNDLTLDSSGTQNETDVDGQVALVESCITKRARAIVIAPADSKALVQVVAKAVKADIKVVNIDVKLDDGALQQAGVEVPFVGPDNRDGARQSGKVLADLLGKGGKVVILEGNPGADNATQRKNGFNDAVSEGGLTLLDSKTAHWETDEANQVFASMLTAHPDIQGVLASNDSMALGAIKVIQERKANVKVASFDNIPAVKEHLQSGVMVSTLDQYGSKQAADGIDFAMKMIGGEQVTGWQKTEIKLITKDNVGS